MIFYTADCIPLDVVFSPFYLNYKVFLVLFFKKSYSWMHADPLQGDFPEVIEEYLEHGVMKCIAFNRRGNLLAGIFFCDFLYLNFNQFVWCLFRFLLFRCCYNDNVAK